MRITILALCLSLGFSPLTRAEVSEAEFDALRAQMVQLADRLSALEAENKALRELNHSTLKEVELNRDKLGEVSKIAASAVWTEGIKLKGDFRYRYEEIDEQGKAKRDRNRVRARAGVIAKLPNRVEVGLGLASGGDDPVSTNQTLGKGDSSKGLQLDLAYAAWQPSDQLRLVAGKMKNILYRPQKNPMLWDGDWNPEGIALSYKSGPWFANFFGNWLESDSKADNRLLTWGGQGGVKTYLGGVDLVAGLGYYDMGTKGKSSFYGDDDDFYGNSFVCADPVNVASCVYAHNYEELELFVNVSTKVGDLPLNLFVDYVTNRAVDDNDTGYALGAKLGKASSPGSWQLAYVYQDLEADAALGLVADSDYAGGGMDGKGHIFKGAYAINKKWSFGFTYFVNERGKALDNEHDYDRLQVDTKFNY